MGSMDSLEHNLLDMQIQNAQLKTAQIQLTNAKLQRDLLELQIKEAQWNKYERERMAHVVLSKDEIIERQEQYAKK